MSGAQRRVKAPEVKGARTALGLLFAQPQVLHPMGVGWPSRLQALDAGRTEAVAAEPA